MGTRKLATRTAGVLAGGFSGLLLADNALALASPGEKSIRLQWVYDAEYSQTKKATFLIPGMGNSGAYCFKPLYPLLSSYGDVWTVNYQSGGIDLEDITHKLLDVIDFRHYNKVTLLLPSWGGVAGVHLLRHMQELALDGPKLYPIFVCSVVSGNDALGPPLWLSWLVSGGPLMKLLWPSAVRASRWDYDRKAHLNPEVDAELLLRHQQSMYYASPRIYIDQARTLHQTNPLREGEFSNVPAAILQCNNDPLVRPEAALQQLRAFPLAGEIITVPAVGHADFVEHPGKNEGWQTTLKELLDSFLA